MEDSRLLRKLGTFSFFRWHTKDVRSGGCSVGFGFHPRKGWVRRQLVTPNPTKYSINDDPASNSEVPFEIASEYSESIRR